MMRPKYLATFLLLTCTLSLFADVKTVLFLPFRDKVQLKEAWELSTDVPRWFSITVDTIGGESKSVKCLPYDSITTFLEKNKWNRKEYLSQKSLVRMGEIFKADVIITGTVEKFHVVKRAVNSGAEMSMNYNFNTDANTQGGTSVIGSLQSYNATIKMRLELYSGKNGVQIDSLLLDSEQKDSGLRVWLPMQIENDEVNFHYLSRTPFGSEYFHKSVPGALMKHYSSLIKKKLNDGNEISVVAPLPSLTALPAQTTVEIEGKILEREDQEVYLNLGAEDLLTTGEILGVYKSGKAIVSDNGDTLGYTEKKIGTIKVRAVKANHFSSAYIESESDSIKAGHGVRLMR